MKEEQYRHEKDVLEDPERLNEIVELGLLTEEADAFLAGVTREAAESFGLPVSLVSLVLHDSQVFAARHGIDEGWMAEANGTPVEWSFCRFAVKDRKPFVVEDAWEHERVKDNPLVSNDGIRCYAGVPLISSKGHAIGSLCVIGPDRRTFADEELARLRRLASDTMERIERRAGREIGPEEN